MTTYYVDNRASGANNGTSETDAWESLGDIAGLDAGDIAQFVSGSGPYYASAALDLNSDGASGNPIVWEFNGCVISGGIDLNNGTYKWVSSVSGTNEYYLQLAGGGNPTLSEPKCGVVNGLFQESSAVESTYQRGTVGSLADGYFGWGDVDTLGYSTVYVRDDDLDPSLLDIRVAQLNRLIDTNWKWHTFKEGIFELSNLALVRARAGATAEWLFDRCQIRYVELGFEKHTTSMTLTLQKCTGYFGGRNFIVANGELGVLNVYNCVSVQSHLFMQIGNWSTDTINIYNSISYNDSYGAIDKIGAGATLNEGFNCWYPSFAGGGALGGDNPAKWTTTAATDIPPSHATTENDQSNLTDPLLTNVDLRDWDNMDFSLQDNSPCIEAGTKWWTGSNPLGIDGEPFADWSTSMGAVQSRAVPFHPTNIT